MSTLWRRWWRALAALLIVLLSWLAGEAFRTGEQVTTLVIDLRVPQDEDELAREATRSTQFSGYVIFVVDEGSEAVEQLCTETGRKDRGARPGELTTLPVYCSFVHLDHKTEFVTGPLTAESLAAMAGPATVLRPVGRVYEAGLAEGSFAWWAALVTGGALAVVLALPSLLSPRTRPRTMTPAGVPRPVPVTPLGGPVTQHHDGYETRVAPRPAPPPVIPQQPPASPPAAVEAPPPPPWEPPSPAQVVLTPAGSSALPELARIVREAGGRATARTHVDPPGGYVAIGDVVVWGASTTGGVLPGEPVGVEYTGDPAAPLTVSPAPSRSVPEQGYHR
ncbi:hypothetical protein [Amycolatopsis kentuckyensis]|uniref:hypothetical protein n=1 Tax=Amycolatopsis kentuckyensis TaxID=218823 RepID=UPI00356AB6C0